MDFYVGNRRELFWDNYLIDEEKTTAELTLHHLTKREMVADLNKKDCAYGTIIEDNGVYRLYYLGTMINNREGTLKRTVCCIESKDGINWEMPNLGLHLYNGSYDNNIILIHNEDDTLDNFFVFIDKNPDCPPAEKYKGVAMVCAKGKKFPEDRELWCYASKDGIRFKRAWKMTESSVKNGGIFDSLNTAYWDEEKKVYICFIRGSHDKYGNLSYHEDVINNKKIVVIDGNRDIRYIESSDFKNWSEPKILEFGEADDYPLYTNGISRYYRAPHILTGFPTRYTERSEWTKSFDSIGGESGVKTRKAIMEREEPRSGLALTDCVFMTSRDCINWNRFDEAFITPGIENPRNWIYGDCYPIHGMIETKGEYPSVTNEISMYMTEGHRSGISSPLYRYTIRIDGFASYRAKYTPCEIVTKPLTFDGKILEINFRTSARGYIYIKLLDEFYIPIEGYESCEIFGDSLDRTVFFRNGCDVSKLAGKKVHMQISMRDADIYSFIFK